jgi:plastocyanin
MRFQLRVFVVCAGLAVAAACGGAPPPPAAAGAGKTVDAATAGSITGTVSFTGTPPVREPFKMGVDKACMDPSGAPKLNDAILVSSTGALQNAFVYVKDGLDPSYKFDVPSTPVTLDQRGCQYIPRIIGVRAGQAIDILNSDPTLHNVHALPRSNREYNLPEPTQGSHSKVVFTVPEVMVRFKCDVHAWMSAYVGVMANPFFAVTDANGSFSITGLPPGTYTLEAWHEKLGTKTMTVTVGPHETQTASFTFAAQSQ